jgi:hypothetical protein
MSLSGDAFAGTTAWLMARRSLEQPIQLDWDEAGRRRKQIDKSTSLKEKSHAIPVAAEAHKEPYFSQIHTFHTPLIMATAALDDRIRNFAVFYN